MRGCSCWSAAMLTELPCGIADKPDRPDLAAVYTRGLTREIATDANARGPPNGRRRWSGCSNHWLRRGLSAIVPSGTMRSAMHSKEVARFRVGCASRSVRERVTQPAIDQPSSRSSFRSTCPGRCSPSLRRAVRKSKPTCPSCRYAGLSRGRHPDLHVLVPAEVARVLHVDGVVFWVSTNGDATPIYLSPADVLEALPGTWHGTTAQAGWGTWLTARRETMTAGALRSRPSSC
jgi:hypothetical protein